MLLKHAPMIKNIMTAMNGMLIIGFLALTLEVVIVHLQESCSLKSQSNHGHHLSHSQSCSPPAVDLVPLSTLTWNVLVCLLIPTVLIRAQSHLKVQALPKFHGISCPKNRMFHTFLSLIGSSNSTRAIKHRLQKLQILVYSFLHMCWEQVTLIVW